MQCMVKCPPACEKQRWSFEDAQRAMNAVRAPINAWFISQRDSAEDSEEAICQSVALKDYYAHISSLTPTGQVWCDAGPEVQAWIIGERAKLTAKSFLEADGSYSYLLTSEPGRRFGYSAAQAKASVQFKAERQRISKGISFLEIPPEFISQVPLSPDETCHLAILKDLAAFTGLPDKDTCNLEYVSSMVESGLEAISPERVFKSGGVAAHSRESFLAIKASPKVGFEEQLHAFQEQQEDEAMFLKKRAEVRQKVELARKAILEGPQAVEACERFIQTELQNSLNRKLLQSKAVREAAKLSAETALTDDGEVRLDNPDYSCSLNAATEGILKVSPILWQSGTEASLALEGLAKQAGLLKDASLFREAVGGIFTEFQRGHLGWFSPRLFLEALMEKLPKLKESTQALVSVRGDKPVPISIISLVPTRATSLAKLLEDNKVVFKTVPKVLILHPGGYRHLSFPSEDELLRVNDSDYVLKSIITTYYGKHSECGFSDLPDVLIYELKD